MAIPLLAISALLGGTILHQQTKQHYRQLERERRWLGEDFAAVYSVQKLPSQHYDKGNSVKPVFGSIVCCEIYNLLDHSAIWIDEQTIIELSNSGIVRAVGVERFLDGRSGDHIFVATDQNGNPLIFEEAAHKAISKLFTYRKYDVIESNCHKFVAEMVSSREIELTRFSSLSEFLATEKKCKLYWDRALIGKN